MGKIKLLDSFVVERIAAGEVVERPASILKELLENSLDAGSSRIDVEVDGGGIEKISVADNGCGMDELDAALCLQRHATSKIALLDDLESVSTFGFRGEALAGIAAVSRLEIYTRTRGELRGTKVISEGGEVRHIGAAGVPEGTHLVVRDLFFNVPARRKFLRSAQTEESVCLDILARISLSCCDAAFQLKRAGNIAYTLPAGETLKSRYMRLFPQAEETQLFSISSKHDSMELSGIIGGPLFCKSSRNAIHFYVNRRSIRPGLLSQAVVDGYSGYLQAGKFPVAILFLQIDGRWVDVNAHPAKAEVRFSHPREIYGFIEKSVAARLREVQEDVRKHVSPFFVPQADLFSHGGNGDAKTDEPVSPGENSSPAAAATRESYVSINNRYPASPGQRYEDLTLFEKIAPYGTKKSGARILSSVAKTYGLFQEEETLFLVDLHNAHERLNFDLLESRLSESASPAQQLLSPLMIELSAQQQFLIAKHKSFFQTIGLELEEFGQGTMLARSVPAGLEKLGQKKFLLSLMERLESVDELKDPQAIRRKILVTTACRSSIQAGDEVSNEEMQALFEKLLRSSNPYFCPHGRPIIIKLTLDEVHKLFRRK